MPLLACWLARSFVRLDRYFAALQAKALQAEQVDPELRQHFSPIEAIFANAL